MKKNIFCAMTLIVCLWCNAETIEQDGIEYVLHFNDHTAAASFASGSGINVETLVIPTTISFEDEQFTVTEIFSKCFMIPNNTICKKVIIPNTVKRIGSRAFNNARNIKEIVLPDGLTRIEDGTFSLCKSLETIVIPESVTRIGNDAFKNCESLNNINLPSGVTYIGDAAFEQTALKKLVVPDGIKKIPAKMCAAAHKLQCITIPPSVNEIERYAFGGCGRLAKVIIPEAVTKIGANAFAGCECIDTIAIPNGVQKIEDSAFKGCRGLKHIALPNSIQSIEEDAFSGCNNLETLVLPASLQTLGYNCLPGCENCDAQLKKIVNYSTTPQSVEAQLFYNHDNRLSLITLVVPKGCSNTYKNHPWWGQMNIIEME